MTCKSNRAIDPAPADRLVRLVAPVGLLAAAALFTSCSSKPAQGDSGSAMQMMMMQAVPVTVGQASEKTVPVEIQVIGNGEAYNTVNVKAQVDGLLQEAHFTQGQDVKEGDVLFSIDPRPFEATLQQAQANLARDQAQLKNAQNQYDRNTALFKEGIISKDQDETFHTNAAALEATVKADEAAIENAKIELGYTTIRSPISGRTGSLSIQVGNLVKNNDAALVVINQITPLYVDFSVPEQYLSEIKQRFAAGPVQVQATIPDTQGPPEQGKLAFINNTVDTSTGTVLLKAVFPNAGKRLWPGQFVNVALDLQSKRSVVVPSQAVQNGPQGKYVFAVKADKSVDLRPVVTGATDAGNTVIEKGVAPGEIVVTDGQLRLFPGAHVQEKQGL
jgi:multidrug efflux system membrane fusion protein